MSGTVTVDIRTLADRRAQGFRRDLLFAENGGPIMDRIARHEDPWPARDLFPVLSRDQLSLDHAVTQAQALQRELDREKAKHRSDLLAVWREMARLQQQFAAAVGRAAPPTAELLEKTIDNSRSAVTHVAGKIFGDEAPQITVVRDSHTESGAVAEISVVVAKRRDIDAMVELERAFYKEIAAANIYDPEAPIDIVLQFGE